LRWAQGAGDLELVMGRLKGDGVTTGWETGEDGTPDWGRAGGGGGGPRDESLMFFFFFFVESANMKNRASERPAIPGAESRWGATENKNPHGGAVAEAIHEELRRAGLGVIGRVHRASEYARRTGHKPLATNGSGLSTRGKPGFARRDGEMLTAPISANHAQGHERCLGEGSDIGGGPGFVGGCWDRAVLRLAAILAGCGQDVCPTILGAGERELDLGFGRAGTWRFEKTARLGARTMLLEGGGRRALERGAFSTGRPDHEISLSDLPRRRRQRKGRGPEGIFDSRGTGMQA